MTKGYVIYALTQKQLYIFEIPGHSKSSSLVIKQRRNPLNIYYIACEMLPFQSMV